MIQPAFPFEKFVEKETSLQELKQGISKCAVHSKWSPEENLSFQGVKYYDSTNAKFDLLSFSRTVSTPLVSPDVK